jgi:general stress protein YciG
MNVRKSWGLEVSVGDQEQKKTKMSRSEAGRKGGKATKERYGEEHFGKIGKIGGKKGGETTKERYGSEFYQKIGRLGGSKNEGTTS